MKYLLIIQKALLVFNMKLTSGGSWNMLLKPCLLTELSTFFVSVKTILRSRIRSRLSDQ